MKIAVFLITVIGACAQTYSSHSGWTFTDSVESATDVLVADIASASATDNGSEVNVQRAPGEIAVAELLRQQDPAAVQTGSEITHSGRHLRGQVARRVLAGRDSQQHR